ncbi:MAG: AAA domain-containing protein [Clostridia bacterium]|jgi:5-methylcytosine-specific restriction endonuclease McrBC GTP-binding regulatory subunit McrB|nr:AAA domain-containing protein [Clostridia bacterium]
MTVKLTGGLLSVIDYLASGYALFAIALILLVLIILIVVTLIRSGSANSSARKSDVAAAEKSVGRKRFDGLSKTDDEGVKSPFPPENDITFKDLCKNFRDFAAGNLKLYYEERDIRKFIAGMAVSHIIILQGMSGTGKTSLAYAFGEYLGNPSTIIPVQPMWKERTDLIGYYNEFTKRFNETDLLKKMYEANYGKGLYITVLDEMNIARVEYYFAEFLSLLEIPDPQKRLLTVVSDEWSDDPKKLVNGHVLLPENMWFIGTANNDDSTFAISDKVYDRAMVMNLDAKAERYQVSGAQKQFITYEKFSLLKAEALEEYAMTARNKKRLKQLDKFLTDNYRVTFGNRIMKQINEYLSVYMSCGGDELEALDDIIAKKVLRKLGSLNPVYIRNTAENFLKFLDGLFGEENMLECKAVIRRLALNA